MHKQSEQKMPRRLVVSVALLACCVVSLTALGQGDVDQSVAIRFIEEFQIIKDRTESELSSISEKAETEYDPNKSHSEQKELFDDLYARSNDVVTAATKKAFEIVEPHSADDAAAEPLAWIATKSRNSGVGRAAIDLLFKHHLVEVTINKISIGWGVVCRLNCRANVQPC